MTNKLAVILGLFILAGIVLDSTLNASQGSLFLAKKFAQLLEWVAFWR